MQRDVTEEYRRAEALHEAKHVQTLLSETAGVGLWRFDPRADRILWFSEWTRMLADAGITMDTPEEFAAVCHPDDFEHVLAAMEAAIEHGRAGAFDHRLRAADGRWISVRAHIRAEPVEGVVHVVHGISQDVTELVHARCEAEDQNQRLRVALGGARRAFST